MKGWFTIYESFFNGSIVSFHPSAFLISMGTVRGETIFVCNGNDDPEFKGAIL